MACWQLAERLETLISKTIATSLPRNKLFHLLPRSSQYAVSCVMCGMPGHDVLYYVVSYGSVIKRPVLCCASYIILF